MQRRYCTLVLILLGLLALPLGLLWPQTLGGKTLLPADTLFEFQPWKASADGQLGTHSQNHLLKDLVLENYAWKRFIVESIQQRQLPLWNPYTFAGEPFLANGQHSALYPFSLLFYVLPLGQAYGWFAVSQLWLAGVWMYLLCRVLGQRRASAVIAAVIYQLSAFFVVSLVFPMVIAAAAWLPFVLASAELLISRQASTGAAPWAAAGALGIGIMMLAGHAEMVYPYTLFVLGTFAGWRWLTAGRARPRQLVWLGVMVGLGLGLGAIQFVPMVEMARLNFREGGASLAEVLSWSFPARRSLAFFIPNFFGNESHHFYTDVFSGQLVPVLFNAAGEISSRCPYCTQWGLKQSVEGGAYVGILTLFLIVASFGSWVSRFTFHVSRFKSQIAPLRVTTHNSQLFFALLALFSLGCIFPTRLYAVIYALPGLSQLHSPFRWVFPLTLASAVLAGFGADVLAETRQSLGAAVSPYKQARFLTRVFFLDSRPSFITFTAGLAFWGGVLVIAGLLLSRYAFPAQSLAWAEGAVQQLALADEVFADGRMFYSYQFPWLLLFGLMLLSAGIVLRVSRCPIYLPSYLGGRPVWELLAVAVIALDLFAYGYGFNPAVDPALLDYTPPVVEFLQQDTGLWRFTTYDPRSLKTMNANTGWFYNLQDVRGYDSMFPKQYARYMSVIDQQDELAYNRIAPVRQQAALDSPLLDLLNVKYVLSEQEIPNTKFTQVYSDNAVRVYRNEAVAPRAFTLPQACTVVADDPLDALRSHDPRTTVIIEALSSSKLPVTGFNAASWDPETCKLEPSSITVYQPNEVWIDVELGEPSWLVLADSYFPGWVAYARPWGAGEEAEQALDIVRADGNFRAVSLAPGAWTVRFRYSPNSVKFGAFGSFIAAMALVFVLVVWAWRRFYHEGEGDSPARRVAKNSLTAILLTLMTRAIDLALAMLMARVLGPDGTGKYYYAVFLFTTFDIFTSFGLHTLLTREVSKDRRQTGRYLANTTVLRLMLGVTGVPVLAAFILIRQSLASTPLAPDTIWTIGLLYAGLAPQSLSTGLSSLFYAYEKAEIPAAISVVTALSRVGISVPVLLAGGGIVGLAGASIAVNLITLVVLAVLAMRMVKTLTPAFGVSRRSQVERGEREEEKLGFFSEFDHRLQRSMLRESFPLMLNHLLATLFFKIDVLLLEPMKGDTVVGWYSQAYKVVDMLNIIPAYFTMALFPVLSQQAGGDQAAARRSYLLAVKLLVMLALPCAVAFTFLAELAIGILGGARFLPDGAIALQLMIWSIPIGWINSVTNYMMIALGLQRKLTVAFCIGLAFNLVANLIFIPLYSYRAAAVVTIFSEIVEGLAFYVYLRQAIGPLPWLRLLWRPAAAAGLMLAVTAALWHANAVLALAAGGTIYVVGLLGLGAIGAEERAVLARLSSRRA
ncbi:MAG: oligosaccharide flippase family protein [Thermoflexales bacterium]|nr:oligosaccharide flippase family protein [Thermoflexales bacterium]